MDAADYASQLRALLPSGDFWEGSQDPSAPTNLDRLILAAAQEPARIDAAAVAMINAVIPDNASTDLDYWERAVGAPTTNLSDTDRLLRIQAILKARGRVDLATLQTFAQTARGDAGVTLANRARDLFRCGISGAGSACAGDSWAFVWALRYMDSVLGKAPDDFGAWDSVGSVVNGAAYSPVTEALTADLVTGVGPTFGNYAIYTALQLEPDVDLRLAVWVRASAPNQLFAIYLVDRSGAFASSMTILANETLWQKLVILGNTGTGGSLPQLLLIWNGSSDIYLSHAVAGVRDEAFEALFNTVDPIFTQGELMVKGEDQ